MNELHLAAKMRATQNALGGGTGISNALDFLRLLVRMYERSVTRVTPLKLAKGAKYDVDIHACIPIQDERYRVLEAQAFAVEGEKAGNRAELASPRSG